MRSTFPPWPYPRWIAHRGAGRLAPENTLAAFRLGADFGYRMFECDVRLSADGIPFLLHDDDLERTTSGSGAAATHNWRALAELDAGAWHSDVHAGERLANLEDIASFVIGNGCLLNIELKPSPGTEADTGRIVAQHCAQRWRIGTGDAPTAPLLSSFLAEALDAARDACPALPRALLLDTVSDDWIDQAHALGCLAVVLHHPLANATRVAAAHAAGLRLLCYTVNTGPEAETLLAAGVDGLITDAVDIFDPAS